MAFLLSVFPLFFSFPYFILFCIKFPTSLRAARRLVCFYFLNTTQNRNKFNCFLWQRKASYRYSSSNTDVSWPLYIFFFLSYFLNDIMSIFVASHIQCSCSHLRMPLVRVRMLDCPTGGACLHLWGGVAGTIFASVSVYLHGHLLVPELVRPLSPAFTLSVFLLAFSND